MLKTETGELRKGILQQIKREYPSLPEKVIFYVESDTPYYGMSENIPPFETGLGQVLLVWYYSTERFPGQLFGNKFLRPITKQDYKEAGGRGFGFFRYIGLLKERVKKYNLHEESVTAFRYSGRLAVLGNITDQTRENLYKHNSFSIQEKNTQ